MTKSEAIESLEKIQKFLRMVEQHDDSTPLSDTDIPRKARRERRNIDDIITFIHECD